MKRVLVTGASGFIGSYLVQHLKGFDIRTLSLREPHWQNQPLDCDVVIHCAGIAHASSAFSDEMYDEVNCGLTRLLIQKAATSNVSLFIFLSSALVFGEGHVGAIDLNTLPNPRNAYAKSKLCAERVVLDEKNLSTLILRLPLVVGPEPKGNVKTLARLARWSPLFIKVDNQRSILSLEDLNSLIQEVIVHEQTGIIHPSSQTLSTSALYQQLRNKPTFYIPMPKFLVRVLITNNRFFAKLFGDFYYE